MQVFGQLSWEAISKAWTPILKIPFSKAGCPPPYFNCAALVEKVSETFSELTSHHINRSARASTQTNLKKSLKVIELEFCPIFVSHSFRFTPTKLQKVLKILRENDFKNTLRWLKVIWVKPKNILRNLSRQLFEAVSTLNPFKTWPSLLILRLTFWVFH